MQAIHIETPRLLIRELLPSDDIGMFEMDNNPEVHRYIGQKPVTHIDQSREAIALVRQQYLDFGIGRWAIMEKATGDFVGWTGFKLMKDKVNHHVDHYDFGYRQQLSKWGQGFGYEAGYAALHYGIRELGLKEIYAMTDVDNKASRGLLEKLGFLFVETFCYDSHPIWREQGQLTTWYQYPEF